MSEFRKPLPGDFNVKTDFFRGVLKILQVKLSSNFN